MKDVFFSIIIPTLNEEKILPRLLKDIDEQQFTDFEVFITDGGSSDRTQNIVKTHKSVYSLKFLKANLNVGGSRNFGAKRASGDYLVFLDADTQISPDFLTKLKSQLEITRADFATTYGQPDTGNIFDLIVAWVTNLLMRLLIKFGKPFMGGQCLIMRRSVFHNLGGFDESVVHAEDHELVQRAQRRGFRGRFFKSPRHLISFRRFEREGRFKIFLMWTVSSLYVFFRGPIRKPLFEYKMGGKVE